MQFSLSRGEFRDLPLLRQVDQAKREEELAEREKARNKPVKAEKVPSRAGRQIVFELVSKVLCVKGVGHR